MDKIRIGIPVCNNGQLKPRCRYSLEILSLWSIMGKLPFKIDIIEVECSTISKGRNALVKLDHNFNKKNIITEYDYFLSLDSDIEFTPQNLIDLYNSHKNSINVNIVSGFYKCRGKENKGTAGNWVNNHIGHTNFTKMLDWDSKLFLNVDWVSAGFCLIKKETFEKIEFPWFYEYLIEKDNKVYIGGEDLGFCKKCNEYDIKIAVDCSIKVNHLI